MGTYELGLVTAGVGALAVTALVQRRYQREIASAWARITGVSEIIATRFAQLEYAERGTGPPVLVIHGAGGGFDQGLLFAEPLVRTWHVIAPSRFGYLRSKLPAHQPSAAHQADAYIDLLDHLGIDRVPVIGISAGARSAAQFAIRHPKRCSALIAVVPALWANDDAPPEPGLVGSLVMATTLRSDFLFWASIRYHERMMFRHILGTRPQLIDQAPPTERARARAILDCILPVSPRAPGMINDAHRIAELEPFALDRITAPTLAMSLADDGYHTLTAAKRLADQAANGRLVAYPDGGHIWVRRDRDLWAEIECHLAATRPAETGEVRTATPVAGRP
jgi:pimeloyl-ACP methyl ester carboxylesterase